MEKLFIPADRAFTTLGRFVLMRPLLSAVIAMSALAFTVINNNNGRISVTPMALAPFAINGAPTSLVQSIRRNHAIAPVASTTAVNVADTDNDNTSVSADEHWQVASVTSQDTLSTIFKRNGLSSKDRLAILSVPTAKVLLQLKPGQEIRWLKDSSGQLQQLSYATRKNGLLTVTRTDSGFSANIESNLPAADVATPPAVATTTIASNPSAPVNATNKDSTDPKDSGGLNYLSGTISHSLYSDSRKLGLSSKQANQLVQIFSQKKVAQNLRPGDTFNVLYQNATLVKGKKISGNVMAAQINHAGKTHSLIRFVDPKGHADYYTPQGYSMRDGISRRPILARLTSGFSTHRMDPVLHEIRPHTGVDYAAPTGTPIKVAGAGVVAEVAYRTGYGNTVVVRHDNAYSTLYAHMSRFASNIKPGTPVQSGQVIGYVGSTGFATGPHLHYEIRVNNVPANPLTVALPGASIPKVYRSQFFAQSKILLAQLNRKPTLLAQIEQSTQHT